MSVQRGKVGVWTVKAAVLAFTLLPVALRAQQQGAAASQAAVSTAAPQNGEQTVDGAPKPAAGTLVDQVLAVVNSDLVLESDVDEEKRFAAFEPLSDDKFVRDEAVERLIDQDLILQQARLQPDNQVTPDEAQARLQALRKDIPGCKQYGCETDAGWQKFVAAQGFTMDELTDIIKRRMEILKFIEIRFRSGILIDQAQIEAYYNNTLLPEYARRHATAPKMNVIKDRIQEILLQQQVTNLLGDWLKTLKAEGSVRVMRPGEVQP